MDRLEQTSPSAYPLLFYGLSAALGVGAFFYPHFIYIPCFFLLYFSTQTASFAKNYFQLFSGILIALLFYLLPFSLSLPLQPGEMMEGKGLFHIENIQETSSFFQSSYRIQGKFSSFITKEGKEWRQVPSCFFIPLKKGVPPLYCPLEIEGTIQCRTPYAYSCKIHFLKETSPYSFPWNYWRYKLKNSFTNWVETKIVPKKNARFLLSMVTGEMDDYLLRLEFNRIGLQHILGVSGFQFVLLAALINFIIRKICTYKTAAFYTLICMSLYFFFLGNSPPVYRAWIAVSLYFIGILLHKSIHPLNALGAGLLVGLASNPLALLHLGFILSFLCTLAILLVYPHFRSFFLYFLPKRSKRELWELSFTDQFFYKASSICKEILALNCAVHVTSIPALLWIFGFFPLLSLVYNLFFPFLANLLFILFILLAWLFPLPWIGSYLASFLSKITSLLLIVAENPPAKAEFFIRYPECPFSFALLITFLLLGFSLNPSFLLERFPKLLHGKKLFFRT